MLNTSKTSRKIKLRQVRTVALVGVLRLSVVRIVMLLINYIYFLLSERNSVEKRANLNRRRDNWDRVS